MARVLSESCGGECKQNGCKCRLVKIRGGMAHRNKPFWSTKCPRCGCGKAIVEGFHARRRSGHAG